MSEINIKDDLKTLEDEVKVLNEQLQQINSQRVNLIAKIQQVSGAAAYIRGKIEAAKEEEKSKDKSKSNK
jgi:hypothetical protein